MLIESDIYMIFHIWLSIVKKSAGGSSKKKVSFCKILIIKNECVIIGFLNFKCVWLKCNKNINLGVNRFKLLNFMVLL